MGLSGAVTRRRVASLWKGVAMARWSTRPVVFEIHMSDDFSFGVVNRILHGFPRIWVNMGVSGIWRRFLGPWLLGAAEVRAFTWYRFDLCGFVMNENSDF